VAINSKLFPGPGHRFRLSVTLHSLNGAPLEPLCLSSKVVVRRSGWVNRRAGADNYGLDQLAFTASELVLALLEI